MRWLRKHIGQGSWLALVALALNFALTFGHVHALDEHDTERPLILALATGDSGQSHSGQSHSGQSQSNPSDHHADHNCLICMALTIIGTALASTPPAALPIELAEVRIDRAIDQRLSAPQSPRASFQSRAPPIS